MTFGNLPTYRGYEGVWMLYAWNDQLDVYQISIDVVPLAQIQARQGYGAVGFWPLGMELREAVDWWTEVKNEPEGPPPPTPEEWEKLNGIIRSYLDQELKGFDASPDFITALAYRMTNKVFVEFLEGVAR